MEKTMEKLLLWQKPEDSSIRALRFTVVWQIPGTMETWVWS